MVTAFPWHFHSAAKIGHDFTELTWLNHHFHLDFLPETISQIGLWQARRRTCSLSIWRHDTTPQDFLASASENRCRAQAFRNAQFEPLPEPSRNKWCWHVLTCLTMSIYIYIYLYLNMSYPVLILFPSPGGRNFLLFFFNVKVTILQSVHKIQRSLLRTHCCSLSLSLSLAHPSLSHRASLVIIIVLHVC